MDLIRWTYVWTTLTGAASCFDPYLGEYGGRKGQDGDGRISTVETGDITEGLFYHIHPGSWSWVHSLRLACTFCPCLCLPVSQLTTVPWNLLSEISCWLRSIAHILNKHNSQNISYLLLRHIKNTPNSLIHWEIILILWIIESRWCISTNLPTSFLGLLNPLVWNMLPKIKWKTSLFPLIHPRWSNSTVFVQNALWDQSASANEPIHHTDGNLVLHYIVLIWKPCILRKAASSWYAV